MLNNCPKKLHLLFIKFKNFGLLFYFCLITLASCGQTTNSFENRNYCHVSLDSNYLKSYGKNGWGILSAPFRWKTKEWSHFAMYSGIGLGIYFGLDRNIQQWSQRTINKTNFTDGLSSQFELFGNTTSHLCFLSSGYIISALAGWERAESTALLATQALALSGACVQLPKLILGRSRPRTGSDFNTWNGPHFVNRNFTSFYSGHSTSVFAIATVIAMQYTDVEYIPPIVYTIAAFSAFSRVHDNAHWLSDVYFGALTGYLIGRYIVKSHSENSKISLINTSFQGTQLFGFSYSFR